MRSIPKSLGRCSGINLYTAGLLYLIILSAFLGSCDQRPSESMSFSRAHPQVDSPPLVYMLTHSQDTAGIQITEQAAQALEYAKINYKIQDISQNQDLEIPLTTKTVMLNTSLLTAVDSLEIERLLHFVNEGNSLIISRPVWDDRLMYLQGIRANATYQSDSLASGFLFLEEVFPGFQGTEDTLQVQAPHSGLTASNFKDNISVIATAGNRTSYPAILRNNIGAGSVFVYNSYTMNGRIFRGLIFSNLLRTLPGIPYEVANLSTIFLDDFPAPVYNIKSEPIATEFDTSEADFVYNIWWPDMKNLADSLGITYTTGLVFNYNAKLTPPFSFEQWKLGKTVVNGDTISVTPVLAREIRDSRHEISYHGYNHYSLTEEEWPNPQSMTTSIEAARRMWMVQQLGDFPVTYIPPHNYIDQMGLQSLKKGMPDIAFLSSISTGTDSRGGGREFGPDPFHSHFYSYPRQTNGYLNTNNSWFRQHSSILVNGIWNHFVHPDDVYDISEQSLYTEFDMRNPQALGWRNSLDRGEAGFLNLFKERLHETSQRYPYLNYEAAKTAAPKVRDYRNRIYHRTIDEDQMVTRQLTPQGTPAESVSQRYFFMYVPEQYVEATEKKLDEISGNYTRASIWSGYLYQFSTGEPGLSFPVMAPSQQGDGNRLTVQELERQVKEFESVRNIVSNPGLTYTPQTLDSLQRAYGQNPQSSELLDQVVRVSVGTNQVDEAISILEEQMLNTSSTKLMTEERLLTFYGWQGRTADAWKLLEKRWQRYPAAGTLQLKNKIVDRYGWPDYQTELTWLQREYQTNPDSTEIARSIVTTFTADSSWDNTTKRALGRLIAQHPRSDTLYAYKLQRSFWYDTTDSILQTVEQYPEYAYEQIKPHAQDLAFMYAGTRGDTTSALQWADRALHFDPALKLQWTLNQQNMDHFLNESRNLLSQYPANDSLRIYIGETLFYQGQGNYTDAAYNILYPLFFDHRKDSVESDLKREMGFLAYEEQVEMYKRYHAMFTDSLHRDINRQYTDRNSFSVVAQGSHQDDNFNNQVSRMGIGAEWGNSTRNLHRVNLSEIFVGSTVNQQNLFGQLYQADYNFTHTFPSQQLQAQGGAGVQYRASQTFPYASAGISYFDSLSFSSLELQYQSVLTNSAIDQGIKELQGTLYREDTWLSGRLRTAISGRGRYFTDNNLFYEGGLTLFIWPQIFGDFSVTPIASGSYGSAIESQPSGVPYFTPDNLITRGAGLNLAYQEPATNTNVQLQLQGNRDNDTGLFTSATLSASTPVTNYFTLQLQANISNSEVYRSNSVGFTLQFNLPKTITPTRQGPPIGGQTLNPGVYASTDFSNSSAYQNLEMTDEATSYKIMGSLSYPDTASYTSLYDHTISYSKISSDAYGEVQSYFNGSFMIDDLSPGSYEVWVSGDDELRSSYQIEPDTVTVNLNSGLENNLLSGVNFTLIQQPTTPAQAEPVQQDSVQHYVVLNYSDSLSQAISLIQRDQPALDEPLTLYFDQSRNLIQVGSESFPDMKQAEQFYNRARNELGRSTFGIKTYSLADTTIIPMTYRYQFGSFRNLDNAQAFVRELIPNLPNTQVILQIDPILGLFEVVTDERTDWYLSGRKLNAIKNKLGVDMVFRDIQPSITP